MQAYCFKCKVKREIQDARSVFTSKGSPATQGICPECGTKLFRMGRTPAHEGLDPAAHTVASKAAERRKKTGPRMVIVESPAKARTMSRFLGKGYTVQASVGHIRDLPANRMGVDIEHDFEPRYVIPSKRKDVVKELKARAKGASEVYLATDPDREGEAIAWHLRQALDRELRGIPVHRVEFHEITQHAIGHAFDHPREKFRQWEGYFIERVTKTPASRTVFAQVDLTLLAFFDLSQMYAGFFIAIVTFHSQPPPAIAVSISSGSNGRNLRRSSENTRRPSFIPISTYDPNILRQFSKIHDDSPRAGAIEPVNSGSNRPSAMRKTRSERRARSGLCVAIKNARLY